MAFVTLKDGREIDGIVGFLIALVLFPVALATLPFRGGTLKWRDRVIWEKK